MANEYVLINPAAPTVSVIIPAYRHAEFVLQTLDSVFAQSWQDFEIIVVNDGSPDLTAQLLQPLVEANRIRYFEQPNQGQATARNRGLSESRGEFIAFLDDDDLWPIDHLQWQVEELSQNPAAVLAYGFCESFGGSQPIARFPGPDAPSGEVFARFAESAWMRSPGQALIRWPTLERIGGFDSEIWGTDDWDLYIRLARCGPFIFRDRLALRYRVHPGNASVHFHRMYRNGCRVAQKNFSCEAELILRRRAIESTRDFTCDEGIRLAGRQRADGKRLALLETLAKLMRIKPMLCGNRVWLRHLAWAITPPPLFRIISK